MAINSKYHLDFLIMILFVFFIFQLSSEIQAADEKSIQRGEYILRASGGCSCHSDPKKPNAKFAGTRPLKTPFGLIYSSNITPDNETGIGNWSEDDFVRSMQEGLRPDGSHLFPIFPYTTFTGMKKSDLIDLKHYLDTLKPISKQNKENEMMPPFGWRFGLFFWKLINFESGEFQTNPDKSKTWNRGAYLVESMMHCKECHTPRDLSGALKGSLNYAGSVDGPEGQLAPNITSDKKTGIGEWTRNDLTWFLKTGQKPDGDVTEGLMDEVINEGYQYLTDEDLNAVAVYFESIPAIERKVAR